MSFSHRIDPPRGRRVLTAPDGSPLTIVDLPTPGRQRWVARKKAIVVTSVRGGLLSIGEASARYALSIEEIMCWQRDVDAHGLNGLRTTRLKEYRALSNRSRQE